MKIFVINLAITFLGAIFTVVPPESVQLEISQPRALLANEVCYESPDQMTLKIQIKNVSPKSVPLLIKDHNRDGYQRPFLWGLEAKIIDEEGNVLTHNSITIEKGGSDWWTSAKLESHACDPSCFMPGDKIEIPPGKHVNRVIQLGQLIGGIPGVIRLKPGKYSLQLRLGDVVSNSVHLNYLPPEGCGG
jgi:hypothetical protein